MGNVTIIIATHEKQFHADDVLGVAILSTIYPNHQIIRSRDPDIIAMADFTVDVGCEYDHDRRRYDHHMPDPPRDRRGHLFSSAGLIWRHYAKTYLKTIGIPREIDVNGGKFDILSAVEVDIRKRWIYPIDNCDNGLAKGPNAISEVVRAMRPINPEKTRASCDAAFLDVVSMVSHIFKRSCFHSGDYELTKLNWSTNKQESLFGGKLIVADTMMPSKNTMLSSSAHFIIHPVKDYKDSDLQWIVSPVADTENGGWRTNFPKEVLGASPEKITELIGCDGISYIHHTGFTARADSREHAIKLCEILFQIGD